MAPVQLRQPQPVPVGPTPSPESEVTLLELLDRVLDKGVVLTGDVTLSVADIDLIQVGLRILLASVESLKRSEATP
jgi:hypothetical protein